MPHVKIELLAGRTDEKKAQLASEITTAVSKILGSNSNDVTVVFSDVRPTDWYIGGRKANSSSG
ncbi:tautomerase family protein [Rhizobium laguerreae]|uniref:tautomerase family protein n=1 Tax=Rhizobium laguerreae TaxID=1076926 RepID=UPI001C904CD1|nr:4-oxalocrotonate tautomerase family protein [Rhizobium laguerreae]MBY3381821.1 4-oxalocrotonate tautomerase family protein [Rhizobium laguerreae]